VAADGRASPRGAGGEPRPIFSEPAALPPQDGLGSHDHQGVPPPGPDPGQSHPEQPISGPEFRAGHRALVHGELLMQGQVLQRESAVAAPEEREESKNMEQEGDH